MFAMFGRKKSDGTKDQGSNGAAKSVETKTKPQASIPSSLHLRRPMPAQPTTASTSRMSDIPGMLPPRSDVRSYGVEGKTLVVGREISLAGQIAACDKLVVEGRVEADLDHCRQLDVSPTGFYKGSAEIDEAEICGRFEGRLTVHKRLRVRATARITGQVTYGQIEVEAGGEISGDIHIYRPDPSAVKTSPILRAPAREGNHAAEAGE